MNKRQLPTDTAHKYRPEAHIPEQAPRRYAHHTHSPNVGSRGTGNNKLLTIARTHVDDPADRPGHQQGRYPKAAGLSPAKLHRGPWRTSPGAMELTGSGTAGTQSTRGLPAKQQEPGTQPTGVRRSYRKLAGPIPSVVTDTPNRWAGPYSCGTKERACGPTNGQYWGDPPTWDTWPGCPQHCLPRYLRKWLKEHLN